VFDAGPFRVRKYEHGKNTIPEGLGTVQEKVRTKKDTMVDKLIETGLGLGQTPGA